MPNTVHTCKGQDGIYLFGSECRCMESFYYADGVKLCQKCSDALCSACNETSCFKCKENGAKVDMACECNQGFFNSNASGMIECTRCIPNCAQCTELGSCGKCEDGFIYDQRKCIPNCTLDESINGIGCISCGIKDCDSAPWKSA